jgi:hypothetical protein
LPDNKKETDEVSFLFVGETIYFYHPGQEGGAVIFERRDYFGS